MKDHRLNDNSEPSTKRDRKQPHRFLSHAVIYGLGSISVQMVSLCLLPIYTHTFSPAEYGVLQLIYRVGDVLNICLMANGVRLATLNFWGRAESPSERQHIPASVTAFTVLALSLGTLLLLGGSRYLAQSLGIVEHRLLACGVFAIMLQAITVMPLALMQARLESTWFVVSTLLMNACQLALVTISLVVLHWGVWGVVLALATTYGLFGVLLTWRELRLSSFWPAKDQLWGLTRFSAPFIPSGLCFMILHNGDQFFLLKHYGPATLGVYALGYRITKGVVTLATMPLMQVWAAWMYDVYKHPDRELVFGRAFTRILAALLMTGTAVIVFQDEILSILGSTAFAEAGAVIGVLLFAHFFLVLGNLLDGAFYVTRRTVLKPYIAAASTCIMVIAYWLLIPRHGAQGAAVATLIGFIFHAGLTLIVSRRVFRIKLEYGRLAALLVLSLGIVSAARWFGAGISAVPWKLLLLGAWPTILWNARQLLHPEERQYVRNALGRGVRYLRGGALRERPREKTQEDPEAPTLIASRSSSSANP